MSTPVWCTLSYHLMIIIFYLKLVQTSTSQELTCNLIESANSSIPIRTTFGRSLPMNIIQNIRLYHKIRRILQRTTNNVLGVQLKQDLNRIHRLVKFQVLEFEGKTIESRMNCIPEVTKNSYLFIKV